MSKNQFPLLKQLSIFTTGFFLIINPTQTWAQLTSHVRFVQRILEREPENRGAPRGRTGAGTRGNCPAVRNKPELVGLMPLVQKKTDPTTQVVLSLTTSERPTFWFYVPYAFKDISTTKFVLLDENNNLVTQQSLPIIVGQIPGIISISIHRSEKPLEIGKFYHYYFVMDCQPQNQTDDIVAEGLIQRISIKPDLLTRLQTARPTEKVAIYAQQGIWQDALTLLGELRRKEPKNLQIAADWQELLQSVGLQRVADQPITSCCYYNKN